MSKRSVLGPVAALVLALCVCGRVIADDRVQADDKSEAEEFFQAGVSLMKVKDYGAASAQFEKSVALYPSDHALFNLASCYEALQRYAEALAIFRALREEHNPGAQMLAAVARHERAIRGRAARLIIQVQPPGASIRVDGREVGKSPLAEPVLTGPGKHVIEAALQGYETGAQEVNLEPGTRQLISLSLRQAHIAPTPPVAVPPAAVSRLGENAGREPSPDARIAAGSEADKTAPGRSGQPALQDGGGGMAAARPPSPALNPSLDAPPDEDREGLSALFWVGLAATTATAATTAVFYGLTRSRYEDFEGYREQYADYDIQDEDDPRLVDAQRETELYEALAWGMGITAGVLAIATGIVLAVDLSPKEANEVQASITPGGMAMRF